MTLLIILLIICKLSSFEDQMKPCFNKHADCNCSFVDYVYVINLDERPEKYEFVKDQLNKNQIYPYRFSAVNGWKLPAAWFTTIGIEYQSSFNKIIKSTRYKLDETGNTYKVEALIDKPGRYLSHCMSKGAIGIVLSHLSIIRDAYESGYNKVWILEDDIEVLEDISIVGELIDNANVIYPYKWDVLYTDTDTINRSGRRIPCAAIADRPDVPLTESKIKKLLKKKHVSKHLTKLGNRYGAYSYILSRSGMRKILDFYARHRIFLPFDMELIYINNLVQFSARRNIVSHKVGSSSDNGAPNYLNN
jgi:GR25 family glycosyltransferase involved in LPS biosynthesis